MTGAHDLTCVSCGVEDDRTSRGHLWCWDCYAEAEELFMFKPDVMAADEVL